MFLVEAVLFLFFIIVVAIFGQWIHLLLIRDPKLPPGPFPLPLVGSLYAFWWNRRDYCSYWTFLKQKYGDAITIYSGCAYPRGVVVNLLSWDALVELTHNRDLAEVSADRPVGFGDLRGVQAGIIWADWDKARDRRKFLVKSFKDLGLLGANMPHHIDDEINRLLSLIEAKQGEPFNPETAITEAMASCVLLTVYSRRFDLADEACAQLFKGGRGFFDADVLDMLLTPYLKFLKLFVKDPLAESERLMEATMQKWLQQECNERLKLSSVDPANPRDVLDVYLSTYHKTNDCNVDVDVGFSRSMVDVFLGAMDTTSKQISWCLFYLAFLPDEQERLFKELEANLPANIFAAPKDKPNLPRLEAFIEESFRYACMAPGSFTRRNNEAIDIVHGRYHVPKDLSLWLSSYGIHFDRMYYGDPENFRTDRWLDPQTGAFLATKFPNLPFGIGRRVCPGEQVGRNLVFMCTAALVQRFKWRFADNQPSSFDFKSFRMRLTRVPCPYTLIFRPRY